MSRPRKPLKLLKASGGYRPDRHGDRGGELVASGSPTKPDWLVGLGSEVWDSICRGLPTGVLSEVDSLLLAGAARWWASWRVYDSQLTGDEADDYKTALLASICWKHFSEAAGKLGLSPQARTQLHVPAQPAGKQPRFNIA